MKRYQSAPEGQPIAHTHHEHDASGRPARLAYDPAAPAAGESSEEVLAMASYLGAIFFSFLPALAIYLVRGRSSDYVRYHAAKAANLSVTMIVFAISALIVGGMLAFDTVAVAVAVVVPILSLVWLVMLFFLVRAAIAAGRGQSYRLPDWTTLGLLR
jgi:uncharacterized protein